jgi:hypothetical protein
MAHDGILEQVMLRLAALEQENQLLRERLGRLERRQLAAGAREQVGAEGKTWTTSRRGLLKVLGLSAGAGAATLAFRPGAAAAATGSLVQLGANNVTEFTTELSYDGSGAPVNGAVLAVTDSSATGYPSANAAVLGSAVGGNLRHGVYGYTSTAGGGGVVGYGTGTTTRGGIFSGPAAQIQLAPGSGATHPTSGAAGDLYVDSTARLWYCKGGTTWIELTASATVAIAAGWNLVGVAPAAAGLKASQVLHSLLAATHGQVAALYGMTNGTWTPSFIDHNGQTSGTDFSLVAGQGYLLYSDKALASFTLQASVQVSAATPDSQLPTPGQTGATLPPFPVPPGQR